MKHVSDNDKAFPPTLQENRVLAGGVTLFQVDDEGRVIFEDRYRRRCVARGSDNVPVDLLELLEVLSAYYRT